VFTASPDAVIVANAIDTAEYFVRQQYLDFLGREPDRGGLTFWSDQLINAMAMPIAFALDASKSRRPSLCRRVQGHGFIRLPAIQRRVGRQLRYSEFSADRAQVIGGPNLEASKSAFADGFVQRAEFGQKYASSTTAELSSMPCCKR